MSYYEKWAAASAAIAIERGIITRAEYEAQLGPDPATLDNTVRYVRLQVHLLLLLMALWFSRLQGTTSLPY